MDSAHTRSLLRRVSANSRPHQRPDETVVDGRVWFASLPAPEIAPPAVEKMYCTCGSQLECRSIIPGGENATPMPTLELLRRIRSSGPSRLPTRSPGPPVPGQVFQLLHDAIRRPPDVGQQRGACRGPGIGRELLA